MKQLVQVVVRDRLPDHGTDAAGYPLDHWRPLRGRQNDRYARADTMKSASQSEPVIARMLIVDQHGIDGAEGFGSRNGHSRMMLDHAMAIIAEVAHQATAKGLVANNNQNGEVLTSEGL